MRGEEGIGTIGEYEGVFCGWEDVCVCVCVCVCEGVEGMNKKMRGGTITN